MIVDLKSTPCKTPRLIVEGRLVLRILSEIRWRKRIPQYVEVPPNIEAKRLGSYFSAVLSYWPNELLLNG